MEFTVCGFGGVRCRANMPHIGQSRPDSGLGFQGKSLNSVKLVPVRDEGLPGWTQRIPQWPTRPSGMPVASPTPREAHLRHSTRLSVKQSVVFTKGKRQPFVQWRSFEQHAASTRHAPACAVRMSTFLLEAQKSTTSDRSVRKIQGRQTLLPHRARPISVSPNVSTHRGTPQAHRRHVTQKSADGH